MIPVIEEKERVTIFNLITFVLQFLASYGWHLAGAAAIVLFLVHKLRPYLERWRQKNEDADYHKDPDTALARMQAIQAARDRQQKLLEEDSVRALQQQKEREERKRSEVAEKLKKLEENGAQRLGTDDSGDETAAHLMGSVHGNTRGVAFNKDYMPLAGGASTSYRAPKRSSCSRGGCGR